MPDNRFSPGPSSCSRETVCIETNKILDSCRDRDCYENQAVFLTDIGKEIIERSNSVRITDATIAWTYISADPIQFNRGFYTVDIRYFVKLDCEACLNPGNLRTFEGIAVLDKRVVLFGGESNVNTFRSNEDSGFCSVPTPCNRSTNAPDVVIDVLDPVILGSRILEEKTPCPCCCCSDIPEPVLSRISGNISDIGDRYLAVSLGIFSVIRITRPCQYLVNATEYNIPDKECFEPSREDPCGAFKSMPFPTSAFSTGTPENRGSTGRGGCKCGS